MTRPVLPLLLLSGCIFGSSPLRGDWTGQMDVSFANDERTFTIESADLARERNCYPETHDPAGCVVNYFLGSWVEYDGAAAFGGDAELGGRMEVFHCTGDDCEYGSATGAFIPIELGWVQLVNRGADGQEIVLSANTEDGLDPLTGDAVYAYSNGQMIGTFELTK